MFGFGFLCSLIGFSICFQSRERSQRKEEKQVFDLRWVYWLIAGIYTFYIGVFHYLANLPLSTNPLYVSVQERFWMQGFLIVSIFAGIGFSLLCIKFPRYSAWLRVCQCLRKWCYWLEITTHCFSWVVRRSNCSPKTRFSWCLATVSRTQRCICSKRCTSEWTWISCICPTLRICGTIERSFRSTRISRGPGRCITSWGAFSKEKAGTRLI